MMGHKNWTIPNIDIVHAHVVTGFTTAVYKCNILKGWVTRLSFVVKVPGPRQLDFGCGPTIWSVLSSSAQCSDITLAEFAPQLRKEVEKWIKKDNTAFDWKPMIKLVAKKENA